MLIDLAQIYSRIRLRGSTRLDFLNRMSTSDLLKVHPGEGRATVLTTPIGRMIDYLYALAQSDSLLLLGQYGARDKTLRWLRKHIFFNDDVHVSDETDTTQMMLGDWRLVERVTTDTSGLVQLPLSQRAAGDALIVRSPEIFGANFFVIAPKIDPGDALANWEDYRILRGIPTYPNEICEDYIPLEAGLWGAVSFNKGCYTGQEIIARMESRGQISKKLCMLTSEVEGALAAGAALLSEGRDPAGAVTSAMNTTGFGYIRTPFAAEGATLRTTQNQVINVAKIVRI
jgi:aminomethyltransferase